MSKAPEATRRVPSGSSLITPVKLAPVWVKVIFSPSGSKASILPSSVPLVIYGKRPKLVTATKQQRWVEIQRDKYGMV